MVLTIMLLVVLVAAAVIGGSALVWAAALLVVVVTAITVARIRQRKRDAAADVAAGPSPGAAMTEGGHMAWYAVRCVFMWQPGTYEERITLWESESFDAAVALAEAEAAGYARDEMTYLGIAQTYEIGQDPPASGTEIFSLLRDSSLAPDEYVDAFFDTGRERTQHDGD